jgi:RNA polymerase sigma-70 factor (ECF subfamily)
MAETIDRLYQQLLVIRSLAGDRAAAEELIALHQPRLRAFVYKMLPGSQNVDDIVQDVWLDVFHDLARLQSPAAFTPWLYRIAHNRVYRSLRRRPHARLDEMEIQDRNGVPDFTFEDVQAVQAAMQQLEPEHREVLLLRFMEQMSYEQIAEAVGCPVGTIRSRLHNAKRQLRRILEPGDGR